MKNFETGAVSLCFEKTCIYANGENGKQLINVVSFLLLVLGFAILLQMIK